MAERCPGCGGEVGRDCFNPQECEWISRDMEARAAAERLQHQYGPEPCQGCHAITGRMVACLGICVGMRCDEDAEARAAVWRSIPSTFAEVDLMEQGRRLASQRDNLIAQGVDPSDLDVPLAPDTGGEGHG